MIVPDITIEAARREAITRFGSVGIDTAALDADLLLAHILKVERAYIYAHGDAVLSASQSQAIEALVVRREKREPVAYLLGTQEFYGRAFEVSSSVLIPRPETELLVDICKDWCTKQKRPAPTILDLCTGSGCVAVTLACELPDASITAADLSQDALVVCQANMARHGVGARVHARHGDLFEAIDDGARFDIIVANPPYVEKPGWHDLADDVRLYEPEMALCADDDGLSIIRRLIGGAEHYLGSDGLLAFEMGAGQSPQIRPLLTGWHKVEMVRDLQGHDRVALALRG